MKQDQWVSQGQIITLVPYSGDYECRLWNGSLKPGALIVHCAACVALTQRKCFRFRDVGSRVQAVADYKEAQAQGVDYTPPKRKRCSCGRYIDHDKKECVICHATRDERDAESDRREYLIKRALNAKTCAAAGCKNKTARQYCTSCSAKRREARHKRERERTQVGKSSLATKCVLSQARRTAKQVGINSAKQIAAKE